jgi:DNA-binding YbaB/EbfC family protein
MKANIPQNRGGGNMMGQIKKMQDEMQKVQQEAEAADYSATSGGGAVSVTVSGSHEIREIKIKPEVVDPEDVEMLEDLLVAAINEAQKKATDTLEAKMNSVTGGMNIPGLNGLL